MKEHSHKKNKWHEELQSNFVNVYTKAEDNAAANLENLKLSQNLSTLNLASPKSKTKKFVNLTSKLMNNTQTQIVTREVNALDKHSEFSKTVTKLQRIHRPTLSLTKLEKSITSMEKELSVEKQPYNHKNLPFLSDKKIKKKVDDTYQKHIRRIARRLKQDREIQERESRDGRQEQESKEMPQETPEKQVDPNPKPRRREGLSLNQTLSLLLKTKLSPKRTTETSLNDIEPSLNSLDRHLSHNFRVSSMNLIENPQQVKVATTTSIVDLDRTTCPSTVKQTPARQISESKTDNKKLYQSLNDIDFIGNGFKRAETAEKPTSTNRFQNKLKKMLQVQSKPEITKMPIMKSQLIDGQSKVLKNSIEFNVSPKSLILNSSHARFRPTTVLQKKEF